MIYYNVKTILKGMNRMMYTVLSLGSTQASRLAVLFILHSSFFTLHFISAQPTADSYRLSDNRQLWHQTRNAAGMAFDFATEDSTQNRGYAMFDVQHQDGDYHRVQDGEMRNNLRFYTERYQKIGKYLYGYGSFDFNMGRTKDRAWSDVMRSYDSNPFISGSNVFGKYDHQSFAFDASLSTIQLGRFTYGANIFYEVGDLSRLRDPRSRINLLDYRLTPSVTYGIADSHRVGFAMHYERRKEKLPSLSTVQTDPNLAYYVMTGLENATGTIGGYSGYMREYVNHEFGGELSYAYQGEAFRSLNAFTLDHGTEYIYGTNKYEPGRYYTYRYGFSTQNRLQRGALLHSFDAALTYEQAYADEYRQERISVTDGTNGQTSVSWNTIMEYKKRYQLKKTDLSLHYRLTFTEGASERGYVGASYQLQSISNKRLLPVSTLDYASSTLKAEGGVVLAKRHLLIDAQLGYHVSSKADLSLADATTDYAVGVLVPDMTVLGANYWLEHLQVEYQHGIRIKENRTQWFARGYLTCINGQHSLNRTQLGLSIGMYY